MKRILSLTLVAIMLLSTIMLTSCDALNKAKDFAHDLFGIGDDVRRTINAYEWQHLTISDNYTLNLSYEQNGISAEAVLDRTPQAEKLHIKYNTAGTKVEADLYYDAKGGYAIEPNGSGGWVGFQSESYGEQLAPFLGELKGMRFHELVYDEDLGAYIYNLVEDGNEMNIRYYFEEGILVCIEGTAKYEGMNIIFELSNFDGVKVELPQYTKW